MESGIYRVYNDKTNEYYIGQSVNVKNRLKQHRKELIKGNHINKKLQSAFNEYGEQAFKFESIKEVEEEFLNVMERYYMDKYDSVSKGYNKVSMNQLVRADIRKELALKLLLKEFEEIELFEISSNDKFHNAIKCCCELSNVFSKYSYVDDMLSEEDEINIDIVETRFFEHFLVQKEDVLRKICFKKLNKYEEIIKINEEMSDVSFDSDVLYLDLHYKLLKTGQPEHKQIPILLLDEDGKRRG